MRFWVFGTESVQMIRYLCLLNLFSYNHFLYKTNVRYPTNDIVSLWLCWDMASMLGCSGVYFRSIYTNKCQKFQKRYLEIFLFSHALKNSQFVFVSAILVGTRSTSSVADTRI